MTKQQLRESTRRIIKQELDEAKVIGKTKSGKDIYLDFNNPAHKNFTAADHDDASQVLLIGKSSASISPARKAAAKQHFLASKAKQQIREAIRRIINQELNETTYPKAGEKGNIKVSQLKKGDILGGSGLEVISISAGAKTPSGKVEVTVKDPKTGKELTKTWGKTTIVKVKDKTNENAPAPSKPATAPGVKEPPSKTPGKKEPRRPLGNPNVQPAPKAKATMKEAEMLKQVIKRFKSKKNA